MPDFSLQIFRAETAIRIAEEQLHDAVSGQEFPAIGQRADWMAAFQHIIDLNRILLAGYRKRHSVTYD